MKAEPAGGASDNDATESNDASSTTTDANQNPQNRTDESNRTDAQPAQLDESSAARVTAILEEDGELSEEEVREVVKPKDETDANQKTSRSAELPEREDKAGKAAAKPASEKQKPEGEGEEKVNGKKADEEEALTPEEKSSWPPEALSRIHKVAARRDVEKARAEKAERERDQLRDQLKGAARPVAIPTEEDPLADVDSREAMEAAIAEYEQALYWATENPDGVTDHPVGKDEKGDIVTRDFSAKEMAKIRAKADRILRHHVPKRVQLLDQQWKHEQVAREKMPELFTPGTEENRFLESARKAGLGNIPGFANWVRWAWMGRKADLEAAADPANGENGKQAKVEEDQKVAPFLRKHPPLAPGVPAARVQEKAASKQTVEQAQERVEAGEGEEAEVDFVGALRQSQAPPNKAALV